MKIKSVRPIDNNILSAEVRSYLNTPRKCKNYQKEYAKLASLVIVYLEYLSISYKRHRDSFFYFQNTLRLHAKYKASWFINIFYLSNLIKLCC
jgi:hypothetical protein